MATGQKLPKVSKLHGASMDSITHIVLGATLGEALAGTKLKKRGLIIGAFAQSLPDIDAAASIWLDPASDVLAHRGITHSLFFVWVAGAALAYVAKKWSGNSEMTYREWFSFFGIQMLVHLFIDTFNAYGTGWLEPFSHERFSFNVLFVADPLFTVWLLISSIALFGWGGSRKQRMRWVKAGLLASGLYLLLAVSNKWMIDRVVQKSLVSQSINHDRYFTTPTALNSVLWFVVAADRNGFYVGHRSIFDHGSRIAFQYFEKNDSLLDPIRSRADVQSLLRFSQNDYAITRTDSVSYFNVLRFGQMEGWSNPHAGFVVHYNLTNPADNKLLIQRGRFSHWNRETIHKMWNRIKGD